jgi:hypothetical protein
MAELHDGNQPAPPERRRLLLVASILAALASAPSLSVGLVGDDYVHSSYLLEHLKTATGRGPWWNMFDSRVPVSEQVSFGGLPWWASSHLRVALLRPLATLSQYLDYIAWPEHPALMHLHNIAIYALIVAVVAGLYRRMLSSPLAIWIATVSYALDDGHLLGTAWIASRNTLLTALFALLCFSWYERGRTSGGALPKWLAPVFLLLAHASSEGALAIWAYLVVYAVLLDRAPWPERIRALVPLAITSAGWIALSSAGGFGVSGSGAYLDPRTDPIAYSRELPNRLPRLVLAQFGVTEEVGALLSPALRTAVHVFVALLLLAAVALYSRRERRDRVVLFFAVGCLVSLLPICAVGAIGRLLFISGFGGHALIGSVLAGLIGWLEPARMRVWARSLGTAFVAVVIALGVFGARAAPRWWVDVHEYFKATALTLPHGKELEHTMIMLVNTRDYLATPFIMLYRRVFNSPGPVFMHVLGVSTHRVSVTRVDDFSLVLAPENGYLDDPTSILVRSRDEPFAVGQIINLFGGRIHIEAITPDGRPARVRFVTFGLDDWRFRWVIWDDATRRFVEFKLPAIGQTVVIPAATGESLTIGLRPAAS